MTPSQTASPAASSTGSSTGDDDVAAILTESARRFFSEACPPALLRRAETDPDPDVGPALWRALDELGLPQACAPETAGGSGLGWAAVRGVIESCGEHGVPVALPEMLAAHLVARAAGLAVPAVSRITLAVARREGQDLIADAVPGVAGAQAVLIEVAGRLMLLDPARARHTPGINSAGEARTRLCWPDADACLAGSVPAVHELLLAGAAIRSAQIAGAARRVVDMSVGYANDRVQFGRPIGKFQAVQQQLAVAAQWSQMAAMASQLALVDAGEALDPVRVAAAREVCCAAAEAVAGIAHAVHGAIGVTAEYDLQLLSRRLKSWAAEFGSSGYWSSRLGRQVLAHGGDKVWDQVVALAPA